MIKYFIDYQHLPAGHERPIDDGEIVGIKATDENGIVVLPNVGDIVSIDNSADHGERADFSGRVRSRYFSYVRCGDDVHCIVNIVIEDADIDYGKLVKM